jgi:hypothetical protein
LVAIGKVFHAILVFAIKEINIRVKWDTLRPANIRIAQNLIGTIKTP